MKKNTVYNYDLQCRFDSRKSFYGKARVEIVNGVKTLYSYNTPVAEVRRGKFKKLDYADCSQTTRRHVREFMRQEGFGEY